MENSRAFESIIGLAVIIITVLFSLYAFNYSKLKQEDGYTLLAKFDRVDGVNVGSEVRLSGIKIGSVIKIELDHKGYLAKVLLRIKREVKLPKDTIVAINSDGLLGGKYINVDPGADDKFLESEEEISHTQSSINFESLIGKFLLSTGGSENKGSNSN